MSSWAEQPQLSPSRPPPVPPLQPHQTLETPGRVPHLTGPSLDEEQPRGPAPAAGTRNYIRNRERVRRQETRGAFHRFEGSSCLTWRVFTMRTTRGTGTRSSLTHFPLRRKFIFISLDFLLLLAGSQECRLHVNATAGSDTISFESGTTQSPARRATQSGPRSGSPPAPSDDSCQLTHSPALSGSPDTTEFSCHRQRSTAPGEALWAGKRHRGRFLTTCSASRRLSTWDKTQDLHKPQQP